ncbi:hypothetical protein CQW23_19492 [Capsicum baccatum]|uniref:Transposase MuDR plant domain-containing protein n=1 Tax=Capsicum baccatum TaxID=33114 RepID=A0A2G2W5Z3_CAPBA|nr:hypothetical protein CQW23_19492 [Capsicum baccatum]
MVDQLDQVDGPISLLEYTSTNKESFISFNKEGDKGSIKGIGLLQKRASSAGEAIDGEAIDGGEAATTTEGTTIDASYLSNKKSSNSDHEDLFVEDNVEFKSDVHEENINLRSERRTYQKGKKRERISNDPTDVPLGEVSPDLGFNETEIVDKSLKGKVIGDEPVYCSFDEYNVEFDLEDGLGRIDSRKVVYDKSAKLVVWQLGMVFEDVNEFRDVVTKYELQRGVQLEKYINESKKGLKATLMDLLPKVEHRMCTRHILANWGKNEEDSITLSCVTVGPSTSKPRGKSRNTSTTADGPPRPRGRPRKTTPTEQVATPPTLGEKGVEYIAGAASGGERGVDHVAGAARGRGRAKGIKYIACKRVVRRIPLHEWFENPTSYTTHALPNPPASPVSATPNPPASPVHALPNPPASTGKRLKTIEMGVLIAENGFTTYNPGFPSSMILYTGSAQPIRSADIIGDLGYKSKIGVRWSSKKAVTENYLDER